MSEIPIQPVIKPQDPIIYNSVSINITGIVLNECAYIQVLLYSDDKSKVDNKALTLTQPDYSNWGSNDQFIIDWVFQQLNFQNA
jgi:hypothetical protein